MRSVCITSYTFLSRHGPFLRVSRSLRVSKDKKKRAIVDQTNIGTVSKATLEKLLSDEVEHRFINADVSKCINIYHFQMF